jgi:hypothetical protein
VEALDAMLTEPSGYDVEQPWDAPSNQAAIARARKQLASR